MHKIVAVKHLESDKHYIFNVPSQIELKKGDVVRVNTRYGDKIATCVTSSQEVNDDVLKMIMQDKRVLSSVTGIYKLTEFTEDTANESSKTDSNEDIPSYFKNIIYTQGEVGEQDDNRLHISKRVQK